MILLLDNFDSFVYNLARYVTELGEFAQVIRSDQLSVRDAFSLNPTHIILSPGPCAPDSAGICTDLVREADGSIPILGVCLGHQCIGEAYGGVTVRARRPMHGKVAPVVHNGSGLLAGLPSPFMATRYHSLVIEPEGCPDVLRVDAWSDEGEIMAVSHHELPVFGVQFHPESVATQFGYSILANFLGKIDAQVELATVADLGKSRVSP